MKELDFSVFEECRTLEEFRKQYIDPYVQAMVEKTEAILRAMERDKETQ